MSDSNKNSIKFKINSIYREYLLLSYYKSGLLKNTLPTEEGLKKLEEIKTTISNECKSLVENLSQISERNFEQTDYIDPLKICADLINSEFFFASQETINKILHIYETNLMHSRDNFQISPLDQMKLNRIDFV